VIGTFHNTATNAIESFYHFSLIGKTAVLLKEFCELFEFRHMS